jgi:glycosyltransferase involved in cell wall biosynthesis
MWRGASAKMTSTNSNTIPQRELSLLSLVIPIFNEEETIPHLRKSTENWRRTVDIPVELVLVNDGSSDRSWSLLVEWGRGDSSVRAIGLSRNFGHQAAVTAGLGYARGDAVVIIDADLQDPLEVINDMLVRYNEGFDVVYGVRISRVGESFFKLATAWLFYRFMRLLVWKGLPQDAGDFRLVSRRCLDVVLSMDEVHRFLRGMITWVGFKQTSVLYHRQKRKHGISKYPLAKMLNFAWNAALSFSILPIRAISISGVLVAAFGFAYGSYSVLRYFIFHDSVPGWTTIIVLLGIIGGMILIGLGVIGEYVGRIYEEIKHRPIYIVQECVNTEIVQHGIRRKSTGPSTRKVAL